MNALKSTFARTRFLPVASLLLALGLPAAPAIADSLESKLEQHGVMTYLKVTDMRAVRRNGLLNVQIEVTNFSDSNERKFYRFKWLDDSGFSVWEDEPWKPTLLYGRQKQLYNVVAPTPLATDFRLVVQSPNNETTNPSSTW